MFEMKECKKKKMADDSIIQTLLEVDKQISLALSLSATPRSKLGHLRPHMKWLEYSCHGLFWLSGCVICLWLSSDPIKSAFFFNLLIALLLDIILVGVIKASLRRRRPDINKSEDMFLTWSVDKMSCPSGHTSRAVMMAFLLISSSPHLYLLHPFLIVWSFCTCASRVLLGRHYIGDVLAGACLGFLEYIIMNYIWAGPETAKWFLDFFSYTLVEDL